MIILCMYLYILYWYIHVIYMIMYVGSLAFWHCSSLSQITLTSGMTVIGFSMFSMYGLPSSLVSVTIPSTITSFGMSYMFLSF